MLKKQPPETFLHALLSSPFQATKSSLVLFLEVILCVVIFLVQLFVGCVKNEGLDIVEHWSRAGIDDDDNDSQVQIQLNTFVILLTSKDKEYLRSWDMNDTTTFQEVFVNCILLQTNRD